jgi:hypothetical protein
MKKIFTLISITVSSFVFGQSFSLYKTNNSQTTITGTITNGYNLSDATSANGQTKGTFRLVNNSTTTTSLNIVRTIVFQNPMLVLDGSTTTPNTYFCFGNTCFPSNVSTANSFDYTILGPSGSTSAPFDNSTANAQPFMPYLEEGATMGKYFVRYKIFNVNNPNDTLSFTYKYNEFLSVNENATVIETISDIHPNPASNVANLTVLLNKESAVKIQVHNSLGGLVYNSAEQKLNGKNKLNIDCNTYSAGLYFVTVTAGETKITKKLIVNK